MDDEILQEEEKKEFDFTCIKADGKLALLQSDCDGIPFRIVTELSIYPGNTITLDLNEIDYIEYGIDWVSVIENRLVSVADIAIELYRHNLWTAEDVRNDPSQVYKSLTAANAKIVKTILDFIRDK